jgi:triosephosphate isomerase
MIVINYKTYAEATDELALSLTRTFETVSSNFSVPVIISPQAIDAENLIKNTKLAVWAQHVDVYEEGQSTGWFPAETAKEVGFQGVLLNHSEHKLEKHLLESTMKRCKAVGLSTLIFAASQEEAVEVSKLKPDFIGYEPPELIGSKTTSVAESKPETIRQVVQKVPDCQILVGAGIKSVDDVKVSLMLGAKGIAVSSAIVLAENPEEKLRELLEGF